jgi:hypothetical protein
LLVAAGLLVWVGATLILSQWSRLSRPSLADRLRPFSPGTSTESGRRGVVSVESVGDAVAPLVQAAGDRLAALFGVSEPLARRLQRIHSPLEPSAFRLRQMTFSGIAFLGGAGLATAAAFPLPLTALFALGTPILTFLVYEQRLASASQNWQKRLSYEIPVVSEQLAMLLNSGYSLGAAIARIASRSHGCVATDLEAVSNRVRQGLSESEALREWAEVAKVDSIDRLVGVLTLHSQAADLGRLVSAEARYARRDLQRRTVESIERRAQQVWVPVTVATLVPGVILLAVPFLSALRLFSNS